MSTRILVLIGALILVALALVFVPLFTTGDPGPTPTVEGDLTPQLDE